MSTATPLFGGVFSGTVASNLGSGLGNTQYMMPILLGFVGLLMVLMIIYIVVQTYKGRPSTTLTGPLDLWAPSSPVVVDRTTVRKQMAASYTMSVFLKLDVAPDMRSAATPLLTLPDVWNLRYDPAHESLVLHLQETAVSTPQKIQIPGFPMQRWNQLVLTLEGRSIDIYINGTLATSAQLENVPPSGNASVTVVPGNMMGSAALAQVWPRRLTVSEVVANYASTADSQGRPFMGASLLAPLKNISNIPNLFCPGGNCQTAAPTAGASQTWEFPYA
jgi:hypothetical protein